MKSNRRSTYHRSRFRFFLIKFQRQENMIKALQGGPWFILNHFLTVRKWEPKFKASSTQLTYAAIWVRLPELPTEFYDLEILCRVGSKLGQLLKIDTCTSTTTRGRYAGICIEVPLEKPLKTHLNIGHHRQQLLYEGLNLLCTHCGRFGHPTATCSEIVRPVQEQPIKGQEMQQNLTPKHSLSQESEWKTVSFGKRHNYSASSSTINKDKAVVVAAPPSQQHLPCKLPNPTTIILGRVNSKQTPLQIRPNI